MPKSNHRQAEKLGKILLATQSEDVHLGAGAPAAAASALASVAAALQPAAAAPRPAAGPLKPSFPALASAAASSSSSSSAAAAASALASAGAETRSVRVPNNRYTPLRDNWDAIVAPVVEKLRLLIRMNTRQRTVEVRASPFTTDPGALQRAQDFLRAFMLGFEVADAVALLRLDDLFVESFEVTDVKPLKGDHLSRAIGRIAGQGGKTKFAIENATRTRIVVADQKVHILGAFANIQVCRDAICSLILGSPPGKVYNSMRSIASRMRG